MSREEQSRNGPGSKGRHKAICSAAVLQAVRVQQVGSVLVSVGTCYTAHESKITALLSSA